MTDLLGALLVALVALAASTVAAVAGFGGGVILLPLLVWAFGVRTAVPVLTIVQLIANVSRIHFNRKELDLRVVGWFALGAVPMAALGALLFASAPATLLRRVLGAFLLFAVAFRRSRFGRHATMGLRGFALVGGAFGFLSALVGVVGPLLAPFYLAHGLKKGGYIGTSSLCSLVMQAVKLLVYGGYGLLDPSSATLGLAIGVVMILGSYLGDRILDRLPDRVFFLLVEAVLIVSGIQFLLFR